MKFLAHAVIYPFALVSIQAQQPPPCAPFSFLDTTGEVSALNTLVNVAFKTGIVGMKIPDPLVMRDKRLDAIPLSVLGVNLTITPVIQALDVVGLKTFVPRPLNVTGPDTLALSVDSTGDFTIQSTVRVEIAQLNKQWWQICWVNLLSPKECPPATIDVDLALGLNKVTTKTSVLISMLRCPPGGTAKCKDLSITSTIGDALTLRLDNTFARIARRIKEVSITELHFGFEKMTQLKVHFHSTGQILSDLGKRLFDFMTSEANEKGNFYRAMMEIIGAMSRMIINMAIKEKFAPLFGATCYDP